MTSILLTGGTGFIGKHLRLSLAPEPVVLLGRKKPDLQPNERWVHVDLAQPLTPEKLDGGEVLCHLAYSMQAGSKNIDYNRHLLDAVNGNPEVKRVVLMSSVSVYGHIPHSVVDEESPCKPVGEYQETKLACEMLWRVGLRKDCGLTVLRPAEVIGAGGKGLMSLVRDALHRPFLAAAKRSVLYHRRLHYVAVSNVVAAVLFCIRRQPTISREVFIVSDDHQPENKSYAAMQDLVRRLTGRRPLPGPVVPIWGLKLAGALTGRPLGSRQVFSSRRIHDAGFVDAVFLNDEVKRVVRSMESST